MIGCSFVAPDRMNKTCSHCWFVAGANAHHTPLLWAEVIDIHEAPGLLHIVGHGWIMLVDQVQSIN